MLSSTSFTKDSECYAATLHREPTKSWEGNALLKVFTAGVQRQLVSSTCPVPIQIMQSVELSAVPGFPRLQGSKNALGMLFWAAKEAVWIGRGTNR